MLNSSSNSRDGLYEQCAGLLAISCLLSSPLQTVLERLSGPVSAHTLSGPVSISEAAQARAMWAAARGRAVPREPGCRRQVLGQGWHC